jgi:hypothetical protein
LRIADCEIGLAPHASRLTPHARSPVAVLRAVHGDPLGAAPDVEDADLLLEGHLREEDVQQLCSQLDDDIVSSYLPSFEREDLLVTMYRAEEISSFSYASTDIDSLGPEDDED